MNLPEVVLDSNVYISGLVFGRGIPRAILVLARLRGFSLHVSEHIKTEVERTLREKFLWPEEQIRQACDPLWDIAHLVKPTATLSIITRDPDDNRILECALEAGAAYLVTGDDDLLSIATQTEPPPLDNTLIVTPRQFLDETELWKSEI